VVGVAKAVTAITGSYFPNFPPQNDTGFSMQYIALQEAIVAMRYSAKDIVFAMRCKTSLAAPIQGDT
jgi:hypothetical protein